MIGQTFRMETTVTELLREFPKVQRAVLAGETVIIRNRKGGMRLTLDDSDYMTLVGRWQLANQRPTTACAANWHTPIRFVNGLDLIPTISRRKVFHERRIEPKPRGGLLCRAHSI